MNQVSSHVPLEELIAVAREESAGSGAARHVAGCERCAGEVREWRAVADGLRVLAIRSEPSQDILAAVFDSIDAATGETSAPVARVRMAGWAPRRLGWRGSVAVAAGLALLAGGGYAISRTATSATESHTATLTATGCSSLKAVAGTLTSVNGSTLTIRTSGGGTATVSTSASTKVLREVAGTRGDITDGIQVTVFGATSGQTIDANSVALGSSAAPAPGKPAVSLPGGGNLTLQTRIASGTVAGAGSSGFTVVEADGFRVRVALSSATRVVTLASSNVSHLETGKLTSVVGNPGPDGTLAATMVEQEDAVAGIASPKAPSLPGGVPGLAHGAIPQPSAPALNDPGSLFSGLGCSQETIATTYLMSVTR